MVHEPESVPENMMHKILWYFEIQTEHLISATKPDLMKINKYIYIYIYIYQNENLPCGGLCCHSGPQSENQRTRIDRQVLEPRLTSRKSESNGDTSCNWRVWNCPQRLRKRARKVENRKMNRDYPNNSIVEIGQITEKSPGDRR